MKNLFVYLFTICISFAIISCSSDEVSYDERTTQITFKCGGDFSIESVTPITRAVPSYITDVFVFDYMNGELIQTVHQTSNDIDFGMPTLSMNYGKHTLYFIISDGLNPIVDKLFNTIKWETTGDTFHSSLTINVTESTHTNFFIDMKRVASQLKIKMNKGFPFKATTFEISTATWFNEINYITGNAVNPKESISRFEIPDDCKNRDSNAQYRLYTLTDGLSFNTCSNLIVYDKNGEIINSATISTVTMERGKCSTYSGSFPVTDNSFGSSQFDFFIPSWEEGINKTW